MHDLAQRLALSSFTSINVIFATPKFFAHGELSPNKVAVIDVLMLSALIRMIWHNVWPCHRSLK